MSNIFNTKGMTLRLYAASMIAALPVPLMTVAPAFAQAPAAVAPADVTAWVGKNVLDPKEGEVGTVSAVNQGLVVVKTDKHEASLPPTSFTYQNGKLYFGMTRAELNAEMDKVVAASAASLVVGASVKGSAGSPVGTIEAIDDQTATIKLASGKFVKIPRSGIVGTPDGAVIGETAENLEAKVAAGPSN